MSSAQILADPWSYQPSTCRATKAGKASDRQRHLSRGSRPQRLSSREERLVAQRWERKALEKTRTLRHHPHGAVPTPYHLVRSAWVSTTESPGDGVCVDGCCPLPPDHEAGEEWAYCSTCDSEFPTRYSVCPECADSWHHCPVCKSDYYMSKCPTHYC